jgi:NAD(P)H dehydrogenase (quinone)
VNIGIFVHSQSGHTSAMGMAITKAFRDKGHEVDIQLVMPAGRAHPRMKRVELRDEIPDLSSYDAVLFGGPVWAFTASPVIRSFIKEIPSLKGKKALCFSTSGFPTAISGAQGGLKTLSVLLEEIEATVLEGEAFFWGLLGSKKKMEEAAVRICERVVK